MARTWLPVEPALVSHRKTKALARLFQCHPYTVVGFLVSLWGYCLEFQSDGRLLDVPTEDLCDMAAPCLASAMGVLPSIPEALSATGFVDPDGRLHDWEEYAGAIVTKRQKDADRKRLQREMSAGRPKDIRRTSAPTAEHSRVQHSRAVQIEAAARPEEVTYATACCLTANVALERRVGPAFKHLVPSVEVETTREWEKAGISLLVATETIADRIARYKPKPGNRQPNSLRYFDAAVREAAAKPGAVPSAATADPFGSAA